MNLLLPTSEWAYLLQKGDSSETSIPKYQNKQRHIPEDKNIDTNRHVTKYLRHHYILHIIMLEQMGENDTGMARYRYGMLQVWHVTGMARLGMARYRYGTLQVCVQNLCWETSWEQT
jgi:hypothetical protein